MHEVDVAHRGMKMEIETGGGRLDAAPPSCCKGGMKSRCNMEEGGMGHQMCWRGIETNTYRLAVTIHAYFSMHRPPRKRMSAATHACPSLDLVAFPCQNDVNSSIPRRGWNPCIVSTVTTFFNRWMRRIAAVLLLQNRDNIPTRPRPQASAVHSLHPHSVVLGWCNRSSSIVARRGSMRSIPCIGWDVSG